MDASIENAILQILRDQGATLAEQSNAIARIDKNIRGSHQLLFGPIPPDVLSLLQTRHENMESKFGELDEEIKGVKNDVKITKAYIVGYASAVGIFLSLSLSWVAKKIGLHF